MAWFLSRLFGKKIAKIEINGVISAPTRKWVLEALDFVKQRRFPALVLRIDSPGGTVGDSQEIYEGICRLRETAKTKVIASFGNIALVAGSMWAWRAITSWLTQVLSRGVSG